MNFLKPMLQRYPGLHQAGRPAEQLPWQSKPVEGVIAHKGDLTPMEPHHAPMGVVRRLLQLDKYLNYCY